MNVILDTKCRRVGLDQGEKVIGPDNMIIDGSTEGLRDKSNEVHVPKNLHGVGSAFQAHRVL